MSISVRRTTLREERFRLHLEAQSTNRKCSFCDEPAIGECSGRYWQPRKFACRGHFDAESGSLFDPGPSDRLEAFLLAHGHRR